MPSRAPLPLSLTLYRLATYALGPFAGTLLRARARRGKEIAERLGERFGHASLPRPPGPLVWMHGASVGESLMLLALVEAFRRERPDLAILVTTNTVTSSTLMAERLPSGCAHQFVPIDHPGAVRGFLEHWRPSLAIFAESELWPNLIGGCERAGVTLALVNARMTQKSLDRWARRPDAARWILQAFTSIGAADRGTADGLTALSGRTVPMLGNLKQDATPAPVGEGALKTVSAQIAGRPTWLAASTHPGEEEIALAAHQALSARDARRLLLLVPRHPERGAEVTAKARAAGFPSAQRSAGDEIGADTSVYVADTLGEMGLWLALADTTLMAGSLMPDIGGHNPLEPALARTPIITGPYTHNFADLYADLIAEGGALLARSPEDIASAVQELSGARRERCIEAAYAIAARGGGVLQKVVDELSPLLPERADAGT